MQKTILTETMRAPMEKLSAKSLPFSIQLPWRQHRDLNLSSVTRQDTVGHTEGLRIRRDKAESATLGVTKPIAYDPATGEAWADKWTPVTAHYLTEDMRLRARRRMELVERYGKRPARSRGRKESGAARGWREAGGRGRLTGDEGVGGRGG